MVAYIFPTPELVAVAWLKTVPGLPVNQIATTLPADNSSWAASGFVQATSIGGSPSRHVPLFQPVMQIDCWANNVNSQKPPWGKAGHLAGLISAACFTVGQQPGVLDLGDDFLTARLMSVHPISDPRRIPGDDAGFARVQLDLAFKWTVQGAA